MPQRVSFDLDVLSSMLIYFGIVSLWVTLFVQPLSRWGVFLVVRLVPDFECGKPIGSAPDFRSG
jgi:hypothetical protein